MMSLEVVLLPLIAAIIVGFTPARGFAYIIALAAATLTFLLSLFLGDNFFSVPWLPGFGIFFELTCKPLAH